MSKSETIVAQIERVMSNPEETTLEVMSELAISYTACCREINLRLDKAVEQAKAGNSSEAIRQMEMFHLIDEYNYVNFARKDEWKNTCMTLGLEVPITTHDDKASQLIQLYETIRPMQAFLSKHRRLALEHTPIKERLELLYSLAPMEMLNPVWDEMIQDYEKKRLEEIKTEFAATTQGIESAGLLQSFVDELSSANRLSPPPEELLTRLRGILSGYQKDKIIDYLKKSSEQLTDAYRQMDKAEVKKYLLACNDAIKRIPQSAVPEEVRQSLRAPMQWLSEIKKREILEKDFEEKLSLLEQSLAAEDDIEELAAHYSTVSIAAESGNFDIPESIIRSYRQRVNMLDTQKRRKHIVILLAIILIAVFVGWGVYFGSQQVMFASRVKREVETISVMIDRYTEVKDNAQPTENAQADAETQSKHDAKSESNEQPERQGDNKVQKRQDPDALVEARKYYDTLLKQSPKVAAAPAIRKQASRLERAEETERERLNTYTAKRDTMLQILERGDTDAATLKQLDSLVLTKSEQLEYENLKERHSKLENEALNRRDTAYKQQIDVVTEILSKAENLPNPLSDECMALLTSAKDGLDKLTNLEKAGSISSNYKNIAVNLSKRHKVLEDSIAATRAKSEDFAMLNNAVGNIHIFSTTLTNFAEKYPEEPMSQDCRQIVKYLPTYEAIFHWNDFITRFGDDPCKWEENANTLKEVVAKFSELGDCAQLIPDYAHAMSCVDKVKPLAEFGGRQEILSRLRRFYSKYMEPLWVWHDTRNDQYYYFKEDPNNTAESEYLNYLTGDGEKTKKYLRSELTSSDRAQTCPAWQFTLATALRDDLSTDEIALDKAKWIATIAKALHVLDPNNSESRFDPILKTILLRNTLDILNKDPLYSDVFKSWLNTIESEKKFNPFFDWQSPVSKGSTEVRSAATHIQNMLQLSNNLDDLLKKVELKLTEDMPERLASYQWCGWLYRQKREWTVEAKKDSPTLPWSLMVCVPGTDGATLHFVEIGKFQNEKYTINKSQNLLMQGLPVFVRSISGDKK